METNTIAFAFLGEKVLTSKGWGTFAAIDMEGHVTVEYNDELETVDVVHYEQILTVRDWIGRQHPILFERMAETRAIVAAI